MTARERLSAMAFCLATGQSPKSDDWYPDPRSFEATVEEYRAEVLRDAAVTIRTDAALRDAEDLLAEARYGRELADLIDPDKETS